MNISFLNLYWFISLKQLTKRRLSLYTTRIALLAFDLFYYSSYYIMYAMYKLKGSMRLWHNFLANFVIFLYSLSYNRAKSIHVVICFPKYNSAYKMYKYVANKVTSKLTLLGPQNEIKLFAKGRIIKLCN